MPPPRPRRRKKASDEDVAAGCLGIITAPLLGIYDAFALHLLWRWFVVPLGAPEIGMAHAYGLMILLSVATSRPIDKPEHMSAAEWAGRLISWNLTTTTMGLLIGWWLS